MALGMVMYSVSIQKWLWAAAIDVGGGMKPAVEPVSKASYRMRYGSEYRLTVNFRDGREDIRTLVHISVLGHVDLGRAHGEVVPSDVTVGVDGHLESVF
jgi:hypothetical protein